MEKQCFSYVQKDEEILREYGRSVINVNSVDYFFGYLVTQKGKIEGEDERFIINEFQLGQKIGLSRGRKITRKDINREFQINKIEFADHKLLEDIAVLSDERNRLAHGISLADCITGPDKKPIETGGFMIMFHGKSQPLTKEYLDGIASRSYAIIGRIRKEMLVDAPFEEK